MITNFIQLDFNKENDLKVPSVQYDSGSRFVKIKLQRNKSPFEIDGYRVTVVANKVDGTEIMNDCTILDGVNGVVQFEITEQFNAVEGVVDCQLKLFKGKTLLTSMPFSINVVKSVSTKEIVSSNELKTLVNALGEVQNIDNRFAQTNAQLSTIKEHCTGGNGMQEHSHVNKTIIDGFSVSDDKLHFNGEEVGGTIKSNQVYNHMLNDDVVGLSFNVDDLTGKYPTLLFTIKDANKNGNVDNIYVEFETDTPSANNLNIFAKSGSAGYNLTKEVTDLGDGTYKIVATGSVPSKIINTFHIRYDGNGRTLNGSYYGFVLLFNGTHVSFSSTTQSTDDGGSKPLELDSKVVVSLADKDFVRSSVRKAKRFMIGDGALGSENIQDKSLGLTHLNDSSKFYYWDISNNEDRYGGMNFLLENYMEVGSNVDISFYVSTLCSMNVRMTIDASYTSASSTSDLNLKIEKITDTFYKVSATCTLTSHAKRIGLGYGDSGVRRFDVKLYNVKIKENDVLRTDYTVNGKTGAIIKKVTSNGELLTMDEFLYLMNPPKEPKTLPYPRDFYTVKNTGYKNNFAVPLFVDYVYDGTLHQILFENGKDRVYLYETMPNKTYYDIYNKKRTFKLTSSAYDVNDIAINQITTRSSVENPNLFVLTIGDSVTAGAVTSQQYWSVCAEMFAREDIQHKRTSKVMMLGSNNVRTVSITEGDTTTDVKACACGVSSWRLENWVTSSESPFVYEENGKKQFSILKWIERYRTHDDNGNKLELGQGTGTNITSANIDKVQCCKPNVIYINSTHNEGARYYDDHHLVIDTIRRELPECAIIVGSPMPILGTWNPQMYTHVVGATVPLANEKVSSRIEQLEYWENYRNNVDFEFYLLPQIAITPTGEGYEFVDCDAGVETIKMATKTEQMAEIHPGLPTHKIWGYELYALLKFIGAKRKAGVVTNFDEVPIN